MLLVYIFQKLLCIAFPSRYRISFLPAPLKQIPNCYMLHKSLAYIVLLYYIFCKHLYIVLPLRYQTLFLLTPLKQVPNYYTLHKSLAYLVLLA